MGGIAAIFSSPPFLKYIKSVSVFGYVMFRLNITLRKTECFESIKILEDIIYNKPELTPLATLEYFLESICQEPLRMLKRIPVFHLHKMANIQNAALEKKIPYCKDE